MPTHDAVKERPEFLTTAGGKYFLLTNGGPPNVSIIEHSILSGFTHMPPNDVEHYLSEAACLNRVGGVLSRGFY